MSVPPLLVGSDPRMRRKLTGAGIVANRMKPEKMLLLENVIQPTSSNRWVGLMIIQLRLNFISCIPACLFIMIISGLFVFFCVERRHRNETAAAAALSIAASIDLQPIKSMQQVDIYFQHYSRFSIFSSGDIICREKAKYNHCFICK
jgi:hypothetical protein